MPTTSLIRSWWSPACEGPFARIALYGDGVVSVDPAITDAVHALSACLEAHSYETRADDTGAYNCRQITGGDDYSLHAYGIAIDINWLSNPYGDRLVTDMPPAMIEAIKAIRTNNGTQVWRWGGDYAGNKDAMHFEIVCRPADLSTGIDPASIPQPKPTIPSPEDDMSAKAEAQINRLAAIFGVEDTSEPMPDGLSRNLAARLDKMYAKLGAGRDGLSGNALARLDVVYSLLSDPDVLAGKIAEAIPAGSVSKADIKAALQEVFADAADG